MTDAESRAPKLRGRPFPKGKSGNPAGRPRGSKHAALIALDKIGEQNAADILASVVEKAKNGDLIAARILLDRVWPVRKGRTLALQLPQLQTSADVVKASAAITAAVASGDITPDEGMALGSMIELHRRAIETCQLEQRITALEDRHDEHA